MAKSLPATTRETSRIPTHLSIPGALLPVVYERARDALAECSRVDECKEWADRALALASYARQAQDDTLEKMAMRIRARAIRRSGELLRQIDGRNGQNLPSDKTSPSRSFSQRLAAEDVGVSTSWLVSAVMALHPSVGVSEEGDDAAFAWAGAESWVSSEVRRHIREIKAREGGGGDADQFVIEGYERLQREYVVTRGDEQTIVAIEHSARRKSCGPKSSSCWTWRAVAKSTPTS